MIPCVIDTCEDFYPHKKGGSMHRSPEISKSSTMKVISSLSFFLTFIGQDSFSRLEHDRAKNRNTISNWYYKSLRA